MTPAASETTIPWMSSRLAQRRAQLDQSTGCDTTHTMSFELIRKENLDHLEIVGNPNRDSEF